jgi:hypothetical protein
MPALEHFWNFLEYVDYSFLRNRIEIEMHKCFQILMNNIWSVFVSWFIEDFVHVFNIFIFESMIDINVNRIDYTEAMHKNQF